MVNINLLPWREKRRDLKKKEFLQVCLLVAIAVGAVVFAVHSVIDAKVDSQVQRNERLQSEIADLTERVKEITELRKQKDAMIARMDVIQSLQGNRPMIVYIFDQLSRTIPSGVFYQSVKREGQRIEIMGIAESNARISELVRRLDASDWFADPRPTDIKAVPEFGEFATQFTLVLTISEPKSNEEEES